MDFSVIIGRYLNKEVLKTMLVVLMVLLVLFLGQRFVLYLSNAAQGHFSSDLVLTLLILQIPVFVSYLLPLSLFLAVLITLGRMHTDNEMTIISACGISNGQVLVYFTPLIVVLGLLTGFLTLVQAPSAVNIQQQLIKEQEVKGDLSLISAGRFQQTSDGKRIIYVEEITKDKRLKRIFFVQQDKNKGNDFSLTLSKKGRYWSDENQQNFLVLEDGNQYQGHPGNNKLSTMRFERYFMELKTTKKSEGISLLKARATSELISNMSSENQAELQWRIAAPISVPLLLLLALPLARVPPRQGKFARLLPGLMIYIGYIILLLTIRSAMVEDNISPWLGTWWVHLLLLVYGYSEFSQWNWLKKLMPSKVKSSNNVLSES